MEHAESRPERKQEERLTYGAGVEVESDNTSLKLKFRFAQPLSEEDSTSMWNDPESYLKKTIVKELQKKKWLAGDGITYLVELEDTCDAGADLKSRIYTFRKKDPDAVPQLH